MADDLSLKLGDLGPLVEEEDRYRMSPMPSRTFKTDLFAFIYEISTGTRPYGETEDDREIERLYDKQVFPLLRVSDTGILSINAETLNTSGNTSG